MSLWEGWPPDHHAAGMECWTFSDRRKEDMTLTPEELRAMLPHASDELVALNCQGNLSSCRGAVAGKALGKQAGVVKDTATEGPGGTAMAKRSRGHPHEDLVSRLVDLLHTYGYRAAGFRPAMTAKGYRTPCLGDAVGFPDLIAFRESDGRRVAIEVKVPPDKLRPEQIAWGRVLQICKVEWYVVKPDDWENMVEVLR